jgi:hypothetical protein
VSAILRRFRACGPALSGHWPRGGDGVVREKRELSFVVVVAMMFLRCR